MDTRFLITRLVLLSFMLTSLVNGGVILFLGYGTGRGPHSGYADFLLLAMLASVLATTAGCLLASIGIAFLFGQGIKRLNISWRCIIFLVMCGPICVCLYALFLGGQAGAMEKMLEWKIVDIAAVSVLYAFLVLSFYSGLLYVLRRPDLPEPA